MTSFWSVIVNAAILSALLSFAVWLGLRLTPRRLLDAASRYAIWWIVLAVSLALPLGHLETAVSLKRTVHKTGQVQFAEIGRESKLEDSFLFRGPSQMHGIALPLEITGSGWLRPLFFFWIAGGILLLIRLLVSYAALYRLSARATDAPPGVNRHGGRGRLAISSEVRIPIASGPFRPSILIPAGLSERVNAADLDRIILHEAAHLARRDDAALFVQRVIEAVFALHPVVRWIARQIDLEREVACDDIVVGSTEDARAYADCLTRMVALCGGVRVSLAASSVADNRSHLSRRVELLIDKSRRAQTRPLAGRFAVIAIGLICAAEVLAKTPLLLAFGVPPSESHGQTVTGNDPPARAPKDVLVAPRSEGPVLIAQSPIVTQRQTQLGKTANAQMEAKDFDGAIATYRTLLPEVSSPADKADLWARIGEAYRYKGDLPASIEAMEKAVALLPNKAPLLANLGLLYDAQHDVVRARQYYERVLAIDPANPLVLNNLAFLLTETGGDLDLALTYARAAQAKMPGSMAINDTIGWAYLKKNMPADAILQFKVATETEPLNPVYHYHYAMALNKQGDPGAARKECQAALDNGPNQALKEQIKEECAGRLPEIIDPPFPRAPGKSKMAPVK